MIIFEGADNSGKTTLARSLGLPYFSAGPAPGSVPEMLRCIADQRDRAYLPCAQDRVTCVSQQVYSDDPSAALLQRELDELVKTPRVIVVYCRPPERTLMDLSNHKVKSYDTEEHLERIVKMQHEFIRRYDDLMAKIPHILYDWTEFDDDEAKLRFRGILTESQMSNEAWRDLLTAFSAAV